MLLGVIDNIWDFFLKLTQNGLTKDLLFYISLGFIIFMVIFFMVKSRYAYEGRLNRSLEKLNRWLYNHEQIDESNLVEFNKLIKTSPKLLRYHWQQYMLYREHAPSYYMSMYNCIEKPLHTSSYTANIKNYIGICGATMLITFLLTLLNYGTTALTVEAIAISLIAPTIILIFSVVFVMMLRTTQNFTLSSLYQNFHLFNRYVDKASTTIPKYVDFEILFTRKEIKGGIPVLNEYLEKRARQEAEELEKARQNAVEHEVYDFEKTGIDGSLILDRAMKESEIYLNTRQRLLAQIQQYDSEIESLKRNYENTSKDYQRKLQASKENIERFRTQQEESTNRIEVNYIRKQQQDEIKKQEQLEKDQDSATLRYDQETAQLKEQIEKCRAELEEKKEYATNVMLSEYDTFATKVYKAILNDVQEKHTQELNELNEQKEETEKELEKAQEINNIKDSVINDLRELIHNQAEQETQEQPQEAEAEESSEAEVENEPNKETDELEENANETAVEEQPSEEQVEQPQETEVPAKNVEEEKQEEPVQEIVEETPVENQEQLQEVVEEPKQEEVQEQQEVEQPEENQEDANPGFYDENGYYWFANGTYYDNHNYYHDENNDIYDADGNYISPEEYERLTGESVASEEQPSEEHANQPQEAEKPVEPKQEQLAEVESLEKVEQPEEKVEEEKKEEPSVQDEQKPLEGQEEIQLDNKAPEEEKQEEQIEEKPKGKRGRPRKVTSEEPQDKPKGKRGRPKKETTTEDEQPKSKGKRGRPRKTEEKEEQVEDKPKGKRGRPKKEASENATEKPKSTGKRGRPKKADSAEENEKPKVLASVVVLKRKQQKITQNQRVQESMADLKKSQANK